MYSSPLFYTHQKIKSVTEAKLEYTHKNLELKRVQTAGLTNSYQFTTEGVFNMDTNIKLFGNFNFSDIHEKDVAYNLTLYDTVSTLLDIRPSDEKQSRGSQTTKMSLDALHHPGVTSSRLVAALETVSACGRYSSHGRDPLGTVECPCRRK